MLSTDNIAEIVKYVYSTALLIFCTVLVTIPIVKEQTGVAESFGSTVANVLLWISLLWLALVEGGQASIVGLAPVKKNLYRESHPITFQICEAGHKGDNLDRYLMGGQFLILVFVYVVNLCGVPDENFRIPGLPQVIHDLFLGSGLALVLLTCVVGQVNSQVNASYSMLDYINTHFMTLTYYVAMAIEASGLLHASYLIQIIIAKLAGEAIESNEPPRQGFAIVLFWGRVVVSCIVLFAAFVVTMMAILEDKTTMWGGVPISMSVVIFFVNMYVAGMLEGLQIAIFAVATLSKEERNVSVWAKRSCDLVFDEEGHGLPRFIIGRQLLVICCFFIIARVTTMQIDEGQDNVLNVSDGVQAFFNTGLLGAHVATIVASIVWKLVASAFPMVFLRSPFSYLLVRMSLWVESSGICASAWVLAAMHKFVAGFQRDEVYIGTAEEREACVTDDDDSEHSFHVHTEATHLIAVAPLTPIKKARTQEMFETLV